MKNSHKLVLALVLSLGIAIACKDMNPEISGGVGTPPTSPKPTEQGGPPVPDQILVPEQEGAVYGIPSGTPFFVDNMWDDMGNIDAIIQQMKINLFHISKSFGIGLAELNDYLEAERARLIDNITRKNNNLGFVSVQHLENDAVARFLLHFGIDPTSVWWMEDHQRGFVNKKFARNGVPVSPMDVVPDDDWNHDDWNSYVPQLSGQEQQRIDSMSRQELIQATQEMGTCSWHYALSRRLDELDAMSARVEGRDPIDMPEPLEPAWPEHETHNGGASMSSGGHGHDLMHVHRLSAREQNRLFKMSHEELVAATLEEGTCCWHNALIARLDELDRAETAPRPRLFGRRRANTVEEMTDDK